jgi:hypothetical protein
LVPEALDPELELGGLQRLLGAEVVKTGAGMRFQIDQWLWFRQQRIKQECDDGVLEDVRMIAGVKAMPIT